MEGVVKFLEDLSLDPTSRLVSPSLKITWSQFSSQVLIIAWKFKAQTQCEFSRDEFLGGMAELGCDAIDKLKQKLSSLEKEINDQNKFKEFYQFTFNYAKNPSQKGLDLEMALAYWNIVMAGRFKFLGLWSTFLRWEKASVVLYLIFIISGRITIGRSPRTLGICSSTSPPL